MANADARPDDLAGQIAYELNKEGLAGQIARIESDRYRRHRTEERPTVLSWDTARAVEDDVYYLKPPPGSVQLFWGQHGSALFEEIREAYRAQDVEALRELSERVVASLDAPPILSVEQAVVELLALPVYFDVHYGKRILASGIGLPGSVELANLLFAYNGGRLTDTDFAIVSYHTTPERASPAAGYDAFLVVAPPLLSAAEARAVELVPDDQLELNIASTINSPSWVTVVHFVRLIVAITMTGNTAQFHRDLQTLPALDEHELAELGAVPSAEKLLQVRRAIFEKYHR